MENIFVLILLCTRNLKYTHILILVSFHLADLAQLDFGFRSNREPGNN